MEVNILYGRINELKSYLFSTDYKVLKAYEQGVECDTDVLEKRRSARDEINRLEDEIKVMVETENNESLTV